MVSEFVIDNSIVMAWCFQDESTENTERILELLVTGHAVVPSIWPLEVCNVLLVAERKKHIGMADSIRFINLLRELPIMVEAESPERVMGEIFSLAKNHGLSSYDASYLDLAMRLGIPLATQDKALLLAARECRVQIL